MSTTPLLRACACTLAALSLAGCAAIRRPPTTVPALQDAAVAQARADSALVDTLLTTLAERAVRRGDRTLDLLLLSGGGQNGAYGAAFLRAWAARRDQPMPSFDLVTGISTGALQSPFAFVGTPEALDTLVALYRSAGDRIAPSLDLFSGLRPTGGLFRMGKLQRTLEQTLDDGFEARLRTGFDEGRRLVVGTADLDLGRGRAWDLSRALNGRPDGRARAVQLLRASSAIPGVFPPMVLDGRVHADGGVVENVLPVFGLADYRRLAAKLRERGVTEPVTVRLWVILNLWPGAAVQVTNPADVQGIGARGTGLLYFGRQQQVMKDLATLARAVSADVPGLRMEFRHTAIPQALASERGAAALFDGAFIERLTQLGAARGAAPEPWEPSPIGP